MSDKSNVSLPALLLQAAVILGTAFLPFYLMILINPVAVMRILEGLNIDLPYPTIFYLKMMLHGKTLVLLTGMVLLAFLFLVEFKCPKSIRPIVKRGIGVLTLTLLTIQIVPHLQTMYALKAIREALEAESEKEADPKRVRDLSHAISQSVQSSLLNSYRQVPGKPGAFYFVYVGPGHLKDKSTKSYGEQCNKPTCILLPTGPESTNINDERVFSYPRDPALDFAPDKVDKELYDSLNADLRRDYKASAVDPMGRYPWIRQVFHSEAPLNAGLSYAFQIRRIRVAESTEAISAKTPFRNDLYEVRILIFKNFNVNMSLDKDGLIPASNLPINSFTMIVRTPHD